MQMGHLQPQTMIGRCQGRCLGQARRSGLAVFVPDLHVGQREQREELLGRRSFRRIFLNMLHQVAREVPVLEILEGRPQHRQRLGVEIFAGLGKGHLDVSL